MPEALTSSEVEQLGTAGFFLRRDWLPLEVARTTRDAVQALSGFAPARVGRGPERAHHREVRGDELRWVEDGETVPGLAPVLEAFETLKDALNREAYLGLERREVQAARYLQVGAHYDRHRDSFRGLPGRRVTFIYYLNERWTPDHGGCLRLFVSPASLDVEPRLGTLLVFLSERVEHEVLPSFAPRWALTAWWSGRERGR